MKNNIRPTVGALLAALCFLTAFFCHAAEVSAESGQLTHRHIGSRENGGGCYGARKTVTWDCHSYNVSVGHNGTSYIYVCGQCGTRWSSPGKVDEPRCSGQGMTTYYEVSCGREGAAAVSFSCDLSTREWAKELDLTASYSIHEGGVSVSGFLWNGSPGGAGYHVTENGTYTLGLTGSGNVDFSPAVSIIVDHIDHTAPAISSFEPVSDAWGSAAELAVNASDSESGLAAAAYSFDGGASWGTASSYSVTENGIYRVSVRDAVGNISTAETTVSRIDRTPPEISVSANPSADHWYDGVLTLSVQAQDKESGLADTPYSFDGGASYLVGNSVTLSGSGEVEIAVKDRAGNVARYSFRAEKKQRPQPTPAPGGGTGNTGGSGTGGNGTGGSGSTGSSAGGSGSTGSSAGGSGSTGSGTGETGNTGGSGNSVTVPEGAGNENGGNGTDGNRTGGSGSTGSGAGGTGNAGSGGNNAGGAGGAGTGENGKGAGVGGISGGNGSTGRGNSGTQGGRNTGNANGADGETEKAPYENGKHRGLNGAAVGSGNGRYGFGGDADGTFGGTAQTLPQHYPDHLPRVEAMTGNRQTENGAFGNRQTGNGEAGDGAEAGDFGMDGEAEDGFAVNQNGAETREADAGQGAGFSEEEAIIQGELLSEAGGQEASMMRKTSAAGAVLSHRSAAVLLVCAAVSAAVVFLGWVWLFGIRIDTRDERGHYRFAGITRVTVNGQERLRVVPLTKQIIRNSKTNELRIRFGLLSGRRCEGETLLLSYRSMRREFQAERTVELHIRA